VPRRPPPAEDPYAAQPEPQEPPPSFDFAEPPPPPRPRRSAVRAVEEPPETHREPRAYGKLMRIGLIALVGIALGVVVWWQRDTIAGAAGSLVAMFGSSTQTQVPPATTTPQQRPKITDRIGQP
jgi:hypothetical protein